MNLNSVFKIKFKSSVGTRIESRSSVFWLSKTKSLGTYFIKTDSINPIIKLNNFNNGDWISKKELIKFTILDKETGIKSYQVKINDKWILFEYEYKKNELFYRFDSYFKNNRENKIEITVEDMVGNKTEKIFTFYRD